MGLCRALRVVSEQDNELLDKRCSVGEKATRVQSIGCGQVLAGAVNAASVASPLMQDYGRSVERSRLLERRVDSDEGTEGLAEITSSERFLGEGALVDGDEQQLMHFAEVRRDGGGTEV
jgi:hypothetical protein